MSWNTEPWGAPSRPSFFAHPRANEFAVPAALAFGFAVHPLGLWIVSSFFYHEFGHAVAAWLCGHWGIPIPIAGYTIWGLERSWFFTALTFYGLGWGWRYAVTARDSRLLFLATAGLILAGYSLLGQSAEQNVGWIVYGGCAGEIIFSTLAVLSFYWPAPEFLRWDFWRWPVLLSGAVLIVHALIFWGGARRAPEQELFDGPVAASHDGDGDWVRLVRGYGWTPQAMADSYFYLAAACGVVIAGQYALGLGGPRERSTRR